jgi:hypothetical protein
MKQPINTLKIDKIVLEKNEKVNQDFITFYQVN